MSCIIPSCKNAKNRRTEGVSFHRFPRDESWKNVWMDIIRPVKRITAGSVVCSKHFPRSSLIKCAGSIMLTSDAVPSMEIYGSELNSVATLDCGNEMNMIQEEKSNLHTRAHSSGGHLPQTLHKMDSVLNHEICRTCRSGTELINIFDEANEKLIPMLLHIANIDVRDDDRLPKYICISCENNVQMAYEFIVECQKTDRILRNRLMSNETPGLGHKYESSAVVTPLIKNKPSIDNVKLFPSNPHPKVAQQLHDTNLCQIPPAIINETTSHSLDDSDYENVSIKAEPIEQVIVESVKVDQQQCMSMEQYVDESGNCINLDDIIEVDEDYIEEDYVNLINYIEEHSEEVKICDASKSSPLEAPAVASSDREKICESAMISQPKPAPTTKKIRKRKATVRTEKPKQPVIFARKTYVCGMCSATFQDFLKYREHRKSHGNSYYRCTFCDKTFKNTYRLRCHVNIHNGVKFTCHICNTQCSSRTNMLRHIRTIHEYSRSHICNVCGAAFSTRYGLELHGAVHITERNFPCSQCDKRFKTSLYLKVHVQTCHDPDFVSSRSGAKKKRYTKIFICEKCGKVCKQQANFQQHMANVHSDHRPFECPICYRTYKLKTTLNLHMRGHTNERPYRCDICGKGFRQPNHLKHHKQSIHEPVSSREFACNFCDKRYVTVHALRSHERVHTGEQPYECNICEKAFTESSALRKHRQKEHSILDPTRRIAITEDNSVDGNGADKLNIGYEPVVKDEDVMVSFEEIIEYEL